MEKGYNAGGRACGDRERNKMSTNPTAKLLIGIFLVSLVPVLVRIYPVGVFNLGFFRVLFALCGILVYKLFNRTSIQRPRKKCMHLAIFGVLHALTLISYFLSVTMINMSMSTILLYCSIIYTALFFALFVKERLSAGMITGLVLAVAGLAIVYLPNAQLTHNIWGYIFGGLSGLFMSAVLILAKSLTKEYDAFSMIFYQNLIAAFVLLPLLLHEGIHFHLTEAIVYLLLGVVCTAVAYILIYGALARVHLLKANIYMAFQIAVPIIIGFVFFREQVCFGKVIGILLFYTSTLILR